MTRFLIILLGAFWVLSCAAGRVVYHRPSVASEQAWIEAPPDDIKEEGAHKAPQSAADVLFVSPAMFGSLGVFSPVKGERRYNDNLGLELTTGWGETMYSSSDFRNERQPLIRLSRCYALKVGWTFGDRRRGYNGPMYLEFLGGTGVSPDFMIGLGAGWIFRPFEQEHGFLVTGYMGIFYMRFQRLVHVSSEVLWGIRLGYAFKFIFDR